MNMKNTRAASDGAKTMWSQLGMQSKGAGTTPSYLDRPVRSHGDLNTAQHFTIKSEKGGTDLCCHWQPKSSKGVRRGENAFCPSEGGEERYRGGGESNKVGRGTRGSGRDIQFMHQ